MNDVREHFGEEQVLELGMMIGQYIALGRMLVMFGGDKVACDVWVPDA